MNNEEKILSMLETLVVKVDKLETTVDKLETTVDKLETTVDKLEAGQAKLEAGLTRVEDEVARVLTEQARQSKDIMYIRDGLAVVEQVYGKKLQAILDYESTYEDELRDLRHRVRRVEQAQIA